MTLIIYEILLFGHYHHHLPLALYSLANFFFNLFRSPHFHVYLYVHHSHVPFNFHLCVDDALRTMDIFETIFEQPIYFEIEVEVWEILTGRIWDVLFHFFQLNYNNQLHHSVIKKGK